MAIKIFSAVLPFTIINKIPKIKINNPDITVNDEFLPKPPNKSKIEKNVNAK